MGLYVSLWVSYGSLWVSMGRYVSLCVPMGLYGVSMGLYVSLCVSMCLYGSLWVSMGRSGSQWGAMGRSGALWVAVGRSADLLEELIHEVVAVDVHHLLLIVTVLRLRGGGSALRPIAPHSAPLSPIEPP